MTDKEKTLGGGTQGSSNIGSKTDPPKITTPPPSYRRPGDPAPLDDDGRRRFEAEYDRLEAEEEHAAADALVVRLVEAERWLRRFVVFGDDHQAAACALFAVYTHAAEVFDVAVYLAVTAPEKQSGKTRLLEALEPISAESIRTSNISPAALYRVVDDRHPVLLVDEADTVFGRSERAEELRGLINAGHRKGNPVYRMKGPRGTELAAFDTFCPKVIAAIGNLPDTIADRSIPIRLQRKRPTEQVERFRIRLQIPEGKEIAAATASAVAVFRDLLADAEPEIPAALTDRAADVWEPLLAVAEAAGGEWPVRARRAAVALSDGGVGPEVTIGVRLLADIAAVWKSDESRLATATILDRLYRIEDAPWADWYGKPLNAHRLGRFLRDFQIVSTTVRLPNGDRLKGFERSAFGEAWNRYVPDFGASKRDTVTSRASTGDFGDSQSVTASDRHASENPENPVTTGVVTVSRFKSGNNGGEGQ